MPGGRGELPSSSRISISTELGLPAASAGTRLAVSIATVKISSSESASCAVCIVAKPPLSLRRIRISATDPWSPGSAVPSVIVSGTRISPVSVSTDDSVAVTDTGEPSRTGFGETERVTV